MGFNLAAEAAARCCCVADAGIGNMLLLLKDTEELGCRERVVALMGERAVDVGDGNAWACIGSGDV